jgi:predicted ATPase
MLLERETQLATLVGYAEEARKAQGRLVFVAGEAGAGKSALVEQLQQDLPGESWYWGACDGLATPRPPGPLFDIARETGGELLELCRADAPREHLFGALLRQVSKPGELHVVVVEYIHWADEATTDLLRFLGRRIRNANVLLIATYRDEGVNAGHPLQSVLGSSPSRTSARSTVTTLGPGSCGPSWAVRTKPPCHCSTLQTMALRPGSRARLQHHAGTTRTLRQPQLTVQHRGVS